MEEWCLDCWQNASNYFLMGYHYQAVLGGNYLAYFRSEGGLLFNASYSFSQQRSVIITHSIQSPTLFPQTIFLGLHDQFNVILLNHKQYRYGNCLLA